MIEEQLPYSQEVVHLEHLCTQFPIESVHLLNAVLPHAQQRSHDGTRARPTDVVKHPVGGQIASPLQVFQDGQRYNSSTRTGKRKKPLTIDGTLACTKLRRNHN